MAEDVKCRISYVEPTNIAFYSDGAKAIVPSNELVLNDLEKYCIAVDLEVIIPNRKACSLAKENNDYIKMNFSSTNGTLSFLHGTNGMFTTNFTDINTINPSGNTSECFGISSIDITYDAWQAPQVTIKFVDVRGGSVMLPEEKALLDNEGNGSIYRALFSLPSPMFKLTVKGFYGKGVTYYLCEESVDIDLDASSGNFNIVAKFIGMMFRVYADIPMTYLCAAPFMDGGEEYWSSMVSSGKFVFKNKSGTVTEMYKFPQLKYRIAMAARSGEKIEAEARSEQVDANTKERIEKLRLLRDTYPLNNWFDAEDGYYFATDSNASKENIETSIENFLLKVKEYDDSYQTTYSETFSILSNCKINEYMFVISTTSDGKEKVISKKGLKELEGKDDVIEYVKRSNVGAVKLFEIPITNDSLNQENVAKQFDEQIKQCNEAADKAKAEYKALVDSLVEEALGFTPSIENIYNLAFAHMDTFMHVFYEHMDVIKRKIDSKDPERIKRTSSDYISDIGKNEAQLPPYPAFYKDVNTTVEGREERRRQLMWPEDIPQVANIDEVSFIKNILKGTELYFQESVAVEEALKAMNENDGNKPEGNRKKGGTGDADNLKGAPSTVINRLIPVTLYDFVNKDNASNPYAWVKRYDENNTFGDGDAFEEGVMGSFALRALHYLSVNDGKRDPETFGKLEALNFVKEFSNGYYSEKFYDFIEKYGDGSSERSEARDIIKRLRSGSSSVWDIKEGSTLLNESGNKISFGLGRGDFFPVGITNPLEMKKDINAAPKDIYKTKKYIPESRSSSDIYSEESTFFYMDNSRDYINELYKGIDTIIDEGDYGIEKNKVKEFKDNIDNIYDKNGDVKYVNDCIYDENGKGLDNNAIYDLLNTSTQNESTYWIKYPTMLDSVFASARKTDSLFDEPYYSGQTSILSKAYLFLMAMPMKSNNKSRVGAGNIPVNCENGVQLKAQLLREGALYWRSTYYYESGGTDPIKTKFNGVEYRQAAPDELYMASFIDKDGSNKETLCVLKKNSNNNRKYIKWKAPEGCTQSRARTLMEVFENWAEKDFKAVEPFLSNPAYYNDNKFSKGINHDLINGGGNLQGNAIALNNFLKSTYFKVSSIFDYYAGRPIKDENFYAKDSELKDAYRGFMDVLQRVYKEEVKKGREATSYDAAVERSQDPFNNTDLRLSTYMTVKTLYDKWFVAPFKGRETWSFESKNSDFNSFAYIDSFYHDISKTFMINVTKVGEWISSCMPSQNMQTVEGVMKYTGRSLYQYLCDIAQNSGGMLMAFPQKIGGQSLDALSDMFRAYSFNEDWNTDESTYVFLYNYKPSEHLGDTQYGDDGMDLETEQVKSLLADKGYQIPAFGVTYAKQNQSYFKNLTLNTNSPAVTEVSAIATMNIASKGAEGARETSLFGQDIYRIKSSYSYQCEFDMMGCMQVVPLMYFQLNNVPFWRGGYIIYKVTHSITPGDMTTHVAGQRLNKYAIPLTDGVMAGDKSPHDDAGSAGYSETEGYKGEVLSKGQQNNVQGDRNAKIPNGDDFNEDNVSPDKPVICLWPAHYKSGEKGSEWYWSKTLIDDYIIPNLRKLCYHDGTPYNVHRIHKEENSGYSSKELKQVINKFGSDQVISVVPHWNGGRGNYFMALRGKKRCDKIEKEDGKRHCNDERMRSDSYLLGQFFDEEVAKVSARSKEFKLLPPGMMDGGPNKNYLLETTGFGDADKSDPSLTGDCACVLTENFFADYGRVDGDGGKIAGVYENVEKNKANYSAKRQNDVRYKYGEGWLFSDEGMTVVANYHIEAIRRYVNNLHDKTHAMTTVGNIKTSKDNTSNNISEDIYIQCANMIGCEVAAFKAVKQVESGNRNAFIAPGKPSILFEGHVFWGQLKKRGKDPKQYRSGNEDILYPEWTTKHYKGGLGEYDRLERAKAIDEDAALASASWGMFQVMGFNHAVCGYSSVKEFVNTLSSSAEAQVVAAANFICHNSELKNALIAKNWPVVARNYNGKEYAKNLYDKKLQAAYEKIKRNEG